MIHINTSHTLPGYRNAYLNALLEDQERTKQMEIRGPARVKANHTR